MIHRLLVLPLHLWVFFSSLLLLHNIKYIDFFSISTCHLVQLLLLLLNLQYLLLEHLLFLHHCLHLRLELLHLGRYLCVLLDVIYDHLHSLLFSFLLHSLVLVIHLLQLKSYLHDLLHFVLVCLIHIQKLIQLFSQGFLLLLDVIQSFNFSFCLLVVWFSLLVGFNRLMTLWLIIAFWRNALLSWFDILNEVDWLLLVILQWHNTFLVFLLLNNWSPHSCRLWLRWHICIVHLNGSCLHLLLITSLKLLICLIIDLLGWFISWNWQKRLLLLFNFSRYLASFLELLHHSLLLLLVQLVLLVLVVLELLKIHLDGLFIL